MIEQLQQKKDMESAELDNRRKEEMENQINYLEKELNHIRTEWQTKEALLNKEKADAEKRESKAVAKLSKLKQAAAPSSDFSNL